jgi:hypothetical protein
MPAKPRSVTASECNVYYVSGHAFISYSHKNGPYVDRLAAFLTEAGIPVWFDKEIIDGDRWTTVIREQIDSCAAVVVVMTPEAERSDWVEREIARAQQLHRPILPLLLAGHHFFSLGNLQYSDVTGGAMPGATFVTRLRDHVVAHPHDSQRSPITTQRTVDMIRWLRDVIDHNRWTLGVDHPETLTSWHQLAILVGESGDRAESVRLFRNVVADRTRVLGPDHPDTLQTHARPQPRRVWRTSGSGSAPSRDRVRPYSSARPQPSRHDGQ